MATYADWGIFLGLPNLGTVKFGRIIRPGAPVAGNSTAPTKNTAWRVGGRRSPYKPSSRSKPLSRKNLALGILWIRV